jgi:hypothetical protein
VAALSTPTDPPATWTASRACFRLSPREEESGVRTGDSWRTLVCALPIAPQPHLITVERWYILAPPRLLAPGNMVQDGTCLLAGLSICRPTHPASSTTAREQAIRIRCILVYALQLAPFYRSPFPSQREGGWGVRNPFLARAGVCPADCSAHALPMPLSQPHRLHIANGRGIVGCRAGAPAAFRTDESTGIAP